MNSGHGVPNAIGWTRLPYNPSSLVRRKQVNKLDVGEQHPPAAVSFDSKIIEHFTCFFRLDSFFILIPYA